MYMCERMLVHARVHLAERLIKVTLFLISLLFATVLSFCLAPSASSRFVCLLPFIPAHASHCLSLGLSFALSPPAPNCLDLSCCSLLLQCVFVKALYCTFEELFVCVCLSVLLSLSFLSTYTPSPYTVVCALFTPLFLMHSRCV